MLPSGGARLFNNRVGWAKTHMVQAGLLDAPRRSISLITDRGREVLHDFPNRIDLRVLNRFPGYQEFRTRRRAPGESGDEEKGDVSTQTPEEIFENAYVKVRRRAEAELIEWRCGVAHANGRLALFVVCAGLDLESAPEHTGIAHDRRTCAHRRGEPLVRVDGQ